MNIFRKLIRSDNGYAVYAYGFNTVSPVYTVENHVPGGHGAVLHSCSGQHGRENAFKRFRYLAYGTPYRTNHYYGW